MHDLPRQKLCELLAKYGDGLCDDPKCLEALLKDVLRNEHKRETFVLISSLREGVAHELRGSTSWMPPAPLAAKLVRQLCNNLALDEAAANWSVESWAIALGIEITQATVVPINSVTGMTASAPLPTPPKPTPSTPHVGVDLAALAMQHLEKARQDHLKAKQDRVKAAQAEVLALQVEKEARIREAEIKEMAKIRRAEIMEKAKIRKAEIEKQAKANAVSVQKEAQQLAEQTRDFATAVKLLEGIAPQWQDAKLYKKICGDWDRRVTAIDASIQDAVQNGRLLFLRGRVQELLKLQPQRDDMRRLLELLPGEPELTKEFTNSVGMKFVLIQPGEFTMGSNESIDERPPHLVEISQPFYLGVFPVTQGEYQQVMGKNPSRFRINAGQPVENVSLDDAATFCERLRQLTVEVQHGTVFRLPTEAEWEYACRAGSTGRWCFGDDESLLGNFAWFAGNSEDRTHPVGEKKANAWGLFDMHGNVWELCSDYYGNYRTGVQIDPQGPITGSSRVFRGGCWGLSIGSCRSAYRLSSGSSASTSSMGFRLAMSLSGHGPEVKNAVERSIE